MCSGAFLIQSQGDGDMLREIEHPSDPVSNKKCAVVLSLSLTSTIGEPLEAIVNGTIDGPFAMATTGEHKLNTISIKRAMRGKGLFMSLWDLLDSYGIWMLSVIKVRSDLTVDNREIATNLDYLAA